MHSLVSVAWLSRRLGDPDLVVVDCRYRLEDPAAGRRLYAAGHIPGAVHFDMEEDLSGPRGIHGGRHPLPDPASLAGKLGAAGIGEAVTVVAYDDGGGGAARLWWMLRYLGHDAVAVLDGGLPAWSAAGLPLDSAPPRPRPRRFVPRPRPDMLAGVEDVRRRGPATILVDSRAPERFRGEREPLDPVPGRIPGAVNVYWQEGLAPDGTWLPADRQAARFRHLPPDADLIVYCGSGVTACANLLALELAGRPGARLYAGSYSDWCSYPDNPVERG